MALAESERFWSAWMAKGRVVGRWHAQVKRSLITLRALIHRETGGIIAAPTCSLPELLGGTRNWDYRYCWLRDATLTLLALMNAGYHDEAKQPQRHANHVRSRGRAQADRVGSTLVVRI
jgi:GH15 family glucan-1,4-alpha-glucosidase